MDKRILEFCIDYVERLRQDPIEEFNIPCSSHGKPKLAGVYMVLHLASGKMYIGSTGDLYKRCCLHRHRLRANKHWRKELQEAYNADNRITIGYVIVETSEEALIYEQALLDHYCALGLIFNKATSVLFPNLGLRHTEETKDKIRQKVKERMTDPDFVQKLRDANLGKKMSETTKERISAALKGMKRADETKKKIAQARTGRKMPSGQLAKHRERLVKERGRKVSISGVVYDSLAAAARALGLHPGVMPNRMKNTTGKYDDWKYV